ncbi:hypothetical protein MNB_SV-12-1447 [hydrothermal vent metagenome]|uniref:Phospholipid-binding protein n=1 Tax=hydrothermal vent metagenome TaxID=652676 RepID=A0A1W1BPD7_9ZZZZ
MRLISLTSFSLSIVVASFIIACGGGGGGSSDKKSSDDNGNVTLIKGYLLDSPVEGVSYSCGNITGITTSTGEFSCEVAPVKFNIGTLELGIIGIFTSDGKVYPQDLVGVDRDNFADAKVIKLTRLLQSLDDDEDIDEKITISTETSAKFDTDVSSLDLDALVVMGDKTLVDSDSAIKHLRVTMNAPVEESNTTTVLVSQNINLSVNENDNITALFNTDTTLTYSKVTDPSNGSVIITGNSFVYIPNKNFNGTDSFTYKISNGTVDSNISTVTITVNDFIITSTAYENEAYIPTKYACVDMSGSNISPQFLWKNAPKDTAKYAIIMDDEDAPCGTGDNACKHWGLFNIPSTNSEVVEDLDISTIAGTVEGTAYNGTKSYAGPCPPSLHTYKTTIFALKESMPTLSSVNLTRSQFQSSYSRYILNSATISGKFQ